MGIRREAETLGRNIANGMSLALRDLQSVKAQLDSEWVSKSWSSIEYCVVWLGGVPDILGSCCKTPSFDFQGNPLQDLAAVEERMQLITMSIIPSGDRWCFFFAWQKSDAPIAHSFLSSLLALRKERIPNALIRLVFYSSENVYLRPEWWEGLNDMVHDFLIARVRDAIDLQTPIRERAFCDDGLRIVDWEVTEISSNASGLSHGNCA